MFIDFFVRLYSPQSKIVGWNKRSGSTNRLIKEQQIAFILTTADKKIKTLQQKTRLSETGEKSPHATTIIGKLQVKVDVDNWSNLEYVPFPFGGTATLVPPGYNRISHCTGVLVREFTPLDSG